MKRLASRTAALFAVTLVGLLAAPALLADDDAAYFHLSSPTRIGDRTLDPGLHVFRATHATNHSLVLVKDEKEMSTLSAVFAVRTAVPLSRIEPEGKLVLSGDTLVTFVHGDWRYDFIGASAGIRRRPRVRKGSSPRSP